MTCHWSVTGLVGPPTHMETHYTGTSPPPYPHHIGTLPDMFILVQLEPHHTGQDFNITLIDMSETNRYLFKGKLKYVRTIFCGIFFLKTTKFSVNVTFVYLSLQCLHILKYNIRFSNLFQIKFMRKKLLQTLIKYSSRQVKICDTCPV